MNGYIQINIGSKEVGLKYNMYAAENLASVKGNITTSANIVKMIWAGVLGNAFVKQTEPSVTFEEVVDWVDELTMSEDPEGVIQKVSEAFMSAQPIQKLLEKAQVVEEKKS